MRRWQLWVGCGILLLAAGLWLWSQGYVNVLSYGMLLLCPLMHLLMHGGHHSGGHGHDQDTTRQDQRDPVGSREQHRPACH
jgi:hypothetical protein